MPGNNKSSRLVNVLDEDYEEVKDTIWIEKKLLRLKNRIESHNPRLDEDGGDDIRWVDGILEEVERGIFDGKSSMEKANKLWKKWA